MARQVIDMNEEKIVKSVIIVDAKSIELSDNDKKNLFSKIMNDLKKVS